MAHPEIPQALCWWALPLNPDNYAREWHPVKVAKAFLQTVDCVIPMMYWGGSKKEQALAYLDQSLKIWRTITDKPILPTGRAYNGDRGVMNADAIIAFAEKVLSMSKTSNLPGISWWYLDGVIKNNLCWDALKKTSKFLSKVTLPQDVLINRLVAAHPDLFPELK